MGISKDLSARQLAGISEPSAEDECGLVQLIVRVLPDGRLTRADAALYIGRRPQTLTASAVQNKGPRCVMVGGRAYYFKKRPRPIHPQRRQRRLKVPKEGKFPPSTPLAVLYARTSSRATRYFLGRVGFDAHDRRRSGRPSAPSNRSRTRRAGLPGAMSRGVISSPKCLTALGGVALRPTILRLGSPELKQPTSLGASSTA
jgi:hypothetical protein